MPLLFERPNARHHPRPRATYMRDFVMGRRVHAVVRLRVRMRIYPSYYLTDQMLDMLGVHGIDLTNHH
jgi:hypothetical protein